MDSLVSTEWLAQHLGEPDLVVVDASWHMPATGRRGRAEYLERAHSRRALPRHRRGQRSLQSGAAHAANRGGLRTSDGASSASAATIASSSMTIRPIRTAARGWFMLRHFGAEKVAILDGGFQKWLAEGRPTEAGEPGAAQRQVRR